MTADPTARATPRQDPKKEKGDNDGWTREYPTVVRERGAHPYRPSPAGTAPDAGVMLYVDVARAKAALTAAEEELAAANAAEEALLARVDARIAVGDLTGARELREELFLARRAVSEENAAIDAAKTLLYYALRGGDF